MSVDGHDNIPNLNWMEKNRYKVNPLPQQRERCSVEQEFVEIRDQLTSRLSDLESSINAFLAGEVDEDTRNRVYKSLEKIYGVKKEYTKPELRMKAIEEHGVQTKDWPINKNKQEYIQLAKNFSVPTEYMQIKMPKTSAEDIPELIKSGSRGILVPGEKNSKKNGTRVEILATALIQKIFIDDESSELVLQTNSKSPDLPQLCLDIKTSTTDGGITTSTSSSASSALGAYNQRYFGISHDILLIRIENGQCKSINFYKGEDIVDASVSARLWSAMIALNFNSDGIPRGQTQKNTSRRLSRFCRLRWFRFARQSKSSSFFFANSTEKVEFLQDYATFLVLTRNEPNEQESRFINLLAQLADSGICLNQME